MGSGPAYQVVTITAVADGAAWEALAHRMLAGDLSDLAARLDSYRYEVEGKLLPPVYWSALQEVDLGEVPTDGREHELSLYMQDTGWPDAPLDDYIELWDHDYWQHHAADAARQEAPRHPGLLPGGPRLGHPPRGHPHAEDHELLDPGRSPDQRGGVTTPTTWPGSYMAKGLEVRDQWESKLLRTSSWSPLW